MASSKRKKHGAGYVVLIAVLILVLLAVVAAVTGYSLVARRVKALQAGAAFTFDYEITSTADSPALYTILQKTGSTKGTVNGLYAPDALQLSISAPDAVIPAGPLTRVYISSSETLYDVGQLYKNIRWRAFCCRTGALAVISRRPSWQACWVWTPQPPACRT